MPYIKKISMKGFKSFASETEILFENGMNVVAGPNGSGKSVDYSSLVTLSNGNEIQIGKLVEEQISKSREVEKLDDGVYCDGDGSVEIISLNKNTGKVEKRKVSKFIKREGDVLYRIVTRTGKEIKATGCHPVMVFKDGEINSVLIRELSKGSLIASPRILELNGSNSDNDFARFIGYIIGDGYLSRQRIEFINSDIKVIEDYKTLLKKFNLSYSERKDKGATRIYINNVSFCRKIKDMFIESHDSSITSKTKKIPDSLLAISNEVASNILAGLYDTDGSIRKDIAVIEFCTKNKKLAMQVQGLLLRFGIISKVKKRLCCASNTLNKIKRDYYYVYIYGIENLRKFCESIPLRVAHKKNILIEHANKKIQPNPNADLLPQEINIHLKQAANLLGIQIKPLRKEYSSFMAYVENRCLPTRQGVLKILPLFFDKLLILKNSLGALELNQHYLVRCMDLLNISGQQVSVQIGLNKQIIREHWATNRFQAKPENLARFHNLIKSAMHLRIEKAEKELNLLANICNSDIYWDEIVSVEKAEKPDYVYDLTIEGNHNFVANNIFVHNSNITDAICFVLGRQSAKSMRAEKTSHLIFAGTKAIRPANEARVGMIFDNSDKAFPLDSNELKIERIVRRNGQSIYRLNAAIKTRQEILELLAQANIDPRGFNIILQGEIQSLVKMRPDERMQIIEEVAGISIYKERKEKSLRELEKTEARLKEISAILRERTAYMRNLEQERQQALKFKQLEENVKRYKATILHKRIEEKKSDISKIDAELNKKQRIKERFKTEIAELAKRIENMRKKIEEINLSIQRASGLEQETLHNEITELRESIATLEVTERNDKSRLNEVLRRRNALLEDVKKLEADISELRKSSPLQAKKIQELEKKKQELAKIEEEKKKVYKTKLELRGISQMLEDREKQLERLKGEISSVLKEMEKLSESLTEKDSASCNNRIKLLTSEISKLEKELNEREKTKLKLEKELSVLESNILGQENIKNQLGKIDICPLCKTTITQEHIRHVFSDCDEKINSFLIKKDESDTELRILSEKIKELKARIEYLKSEVNNSNIQSIQLNNLESLKMRLKRLTENENSIKAEILELAKKKSKTESGYYDNKNVEEKYERLILEIEEISSRTEDNLDITFETKQRDLEQMKIIIKQTYRDEEELKSEIENSAEKLNEKISQLEKKQQQELLLQEKFKKLFAERNELQKKIEESSVNLLNKQNERGIIENALNNFKVDKARVDAERETLEIDFTAYKDIQLISASLSELRDKLQKAEDSLRMIGSVNLRALEVYAHIKEQFEEVAEKANTLEKEKLEILKIIEEIDTKKRKTFMKTLFAINELLMRNFMQLSTKGQVFLDLENKEDPFAGGLDIIMKVGKGKYFDVSSLSGGEQVLVALSLIFAIQEYNPYCFYIFDEVDAALDKRNSERLAALIKKYMKIGQYIIITHNDAILTEATTLYGVTMQDGVSKILSLHV